MCHRSEILLTGINVGVGVDDAGILDAAAKKMKQAGFDPADLRFQLYKKSVDARKRDDIRFIATVLVSGESRKLPSGKKLAELGGREHNEEKLEISFGSEKMGARPLIIGTGPAGMFCGLLLAQNGYAPILIERGGSVREREAAVDGFYRSHILNTESNIQFGAGGAGTFSDGKLITRISDARCAYVLRKLYEFGAPENILTQSRPHVGTDILKTVTDNLLGEICRLGGEVRYNCRLDGFSEYPDAIAAHTTAGDIKCGVMILAPGHSARDTYAMLLRKGFDVTPKAFSVGVRVEHLQSDIDEALYGRFAGMPTLGHAEYNLSDTSGKRGVYTFCMCPGGEVVCASSEDGCLVTNGMSNNARDGRNANSAVAVSVLPEDYGNTVNGAVEYQRLIERAAFSAGGGGFCAPIQTVGDFLDSVAIHEPGRITPTYMQGNVRVAELGSVFPKLVGDTLRCGLRSFGKRITGFDAPDALLTGAETRTSSPVRINRGEDMTALFHDRIYPCGEGAGYAGGITSAAVDGIRAAQAVMARYAPDAGAV